MAKATDFSKHFPGPGTINRFVLSNGLTVLTFSNLSAQSVHLIGLIENGARLDPSGKLGCAHFSASMLSRGTTARSFSAFHEILESRGANLSFSSGTHQTWLHGNALAEDIGVLFDLASDGLRRPAFAPDYVERMRQQLLAGLAIRGQDTAEIAALVFGQTLFPGHPYGNPVDGYIKTVKAITRQDLVDYHANYYQPSRMIMVIAGALEGVDIKALADSSFGDWENNAMEITPVPEIPPAPQELIRKHSHIEEKSQADLILGTFGPARGSEDYLPAYLGNNILGQFGLMGRIGEIVRSKSGLAYHAASSLNAWTDGGTWEFIAGLNPENMDKVVRLIRDEIKRFVSEPVTAEELDDSCSNLIGRLPLSLESNAGIANAILTMERFNLGLDYYQHYAEAISTITPERILETAQRYLHPDHLVIASAGPGKEIP